MCRLMGFVSHEKTTFPHMAGPGFKDFVALSSIHCDGWGVSTIDHDEEKAHLVRAAEMAHTSSQFDSAIANANSDGGLLHLRWATAGLPVSENNSHPFVYNDYTFIHNGSIMPPSSLDPYIDPEFSWMITGDTDSERYFYLLMTEIKKHGFVAGVQRAVAIVKKHADFSSINAMIMNEDLFIALAEFDPERRPDFGDPDYYDLHYRKDAEGVVVASTGWPHEGWTPLPNHHMLVVDRTTFESKILPL